MGIDYSVVLYVHVDRLGDAVRSLDRHIGGHEARDSDPEVSPTTLVLPDGSRTPSRMTHSPGPPFQQEATVVVSKELRARLHGALWFPLDDQLELHVPEAPRREVDGQVYVIIGRVYLSIDLGDLWARLSFTPAATDQSLAFRDSPAVHAMFLDILESSDPRGVGYIDLEDAGWMWLRHAPIMVARFFTDENPEPPELVKLSGVDGSAAALLYVEQSLFRPGRDTEPNRR